MFVVDASALIRSKNHHYQFARIPQFWRWLEHHVVAGTLKTPSEIFDEMIKQDDELKEWVLNLKDQIIPADSDYDTNIPDVLDCYGGATNLSEADIEKIGKDPYLIACAIELGGTVVTEEVSRPSAVGANRKIPDVCNELGVPWIDIGGVQVRQGLVDLLDFKASDWNN